MGSEWWHTRLLRGIPPLGAGGGGDAHDPHRPARARTHVRGEPARVAVPDARSSCEASGGWEDGDRRSAVLLPQRVGRVLPPCAAPPCAATLAATSPRRHAQRHCGCALPSRKATPPADTSRRRTQPEGPRPRTAATRRDAAGAPRHRVQRCHRRTRAAMPPAEVFLILLFLHNIRIA